MAAEEEKHLREIEGEWAALVKRNKRILKAPVFLHFDYNELNRLFPSPEELRKRHLERLSLEEALHLALSMEQGAHRFFKRYAEKFNDTRGKAIFLKFAEEELEHCDLIQQECDRLLASSTLTPQSQAAASRLGDGGLTVEPSLKTFPPKSVLLAFAPQSKMNPGHEQAGKSRPNAGGAARHDVAIVGYILQVGKETGALGQLVFCREIENGVGVGSLQQRR